MVDVLFKILIIFFTVYGFIKFLKEQLYSFKIKKINTEFTFVINTKNCAEVLEGVVRVIIRNFLNETEGEFVPNILIIDMGSSDETSQIALKLSHEYDFINHITLYDNAINITKD